MKDLFDSFYQLKDDDYKELWENAIFVFDTSVLLNLYRYQTSTRDSLLKVLDNLKERLWIPHHVALEYQRNRLEVIAEQYEKFNEVNTIINSLTSETTSKFKNLNLEKRHSHINPKQFIDSMENARDEFIKHLDILKNECIHTTSPDIIRDQLDNIFKSNIGEPDSQEELNKMFEEGNKRYENETPPGYEDSSKSDSTFIYNGILYKNKFGDLIIWKQIIQYAKKEGIKNLLFITDDNKSDWWQRIKGQTIGPRQELINEIKKESKIKRFHLYSTDNFLKYSNIYLKTNINDDTIQEVRETSSTQTYIFDPIIGTKFGKVILNSTETAIQQWLLEKYNNITINDNYPYLTIEFNNGKILKGYEYKVVISPYELNKSIQRARNFLMHNPSYIEINIILLNQSRNLLNYIDRAPELNAQSINIIFGQLEPNSEGELLFTEDYTVGLARSYSYY